MTVEQIAIWLYDEFDPDQGMEPDACDAQYGPHWPWDQKVDSEKEYWRDKARELLALMK